MRATNVELDLHNLVKSSDDFALMKLYDLHGLEVARKLKRWYPMIAVSDEALITEAVTEAFFGYHNNPYTYNPELNTLRRFLEIAAERDLKNILQREKKYYDKIVSNESVEVDAKFWNSVISDHPSAVQELIIDERLKLIQDELASHFVSETDITLAKLVLAEERETQTFSSVLNISDQPVDKQRILVKKHKDRIKKVLQRNQVESKIRTLLQ